MILQRNQVIFYKKRKFKFKNKKNMQVIYMNKMKNSLKMIDNCKIA